MLYDVLGDVVCGGFAVPIRREYANAILLVTSGEFMALYAANNILRGIYNFDGEELSRVAGIVLNARNTPQERERVERFARAVQLPVVVRIPRSEAFSTAEQHGCTVMQLDGYEEEKAIFADLAERIGRGLPLYPARPLTDEALESCVLYGKLPEAPDAARKTCQYRQSEQTLTTRPAAAAPYTAPERGSPPARAPLYGCAFNGAATTAVHLTDAIVIAHSPRSCAFYTWQNISSPGRRNLFHRGILMPSAVSPNFTCTEMGQTEAVFGGTDLLRAHVQRALERRPGAVVVITSCVSGIIGDDVLSVERLSTEETPVIVVKADGDISGDYMEGIRLCLHALAERLVDRNVPIRPKTVNLIGEIGVANELDVNWRTIRDLLERMGIAINCRFLGGTETARLRGLLSAPLNLLASDGEDNRGLKTWLEQTYACRFLDGCLPVGFAQTRRFLEEIGAFFGCAEPVAAIVEQERARYDAAIRELRPALAGKRVLITTINTNLDWLLTAAEDVGARFVWIGVLNYLHRELHVSDDPARQEIIHEIADWPAVEEAIVRTKPDIVLSNYTSSAPAGEYVTDNMPMQQAVGFHSAIHTLRRWARLLEQHTEGEWLRDKELFEAYYA